MCDKFGCGPTVVSKKKGGGTDRQTKKTAALYSRLAGYPASLGREGRGGRGGEGGEGGGEGAREGAREGGARAKLVFPPSLEPSLPLRSGPSLPLRSGSSLPPPTLRNITSSNVEL